MILTKSSLRDLKTALMAIPGHPGSSRISEALARGFGFDDHHALKANLDAYEVSISDLPSDLDFDTASFIKAVGASERQTILDLATTAQYIADGGIFLDDLESYPELRGGRVILTGWTSKDWTLAASDFVERIGSIIGTTTWVLTMVDSLWDIEVAVFGDSEALTFDVHDPEKGVRRPTLQEHYASDKLEESTGVTIMGFIDGTFARFRDMLPKHSQPSAQYLAASEKGVRMVHGDAEYTVEVWLLIRSGS
ncbi:hypothetical protein LCGC14_0408420 [marine sediment metagenome]|uniref:Uncharacterized protein n=2 Tax=root TaxID=1 RepID=A0A7V1BGZ6_9RHOB|nr:hypothetical protein [Sulfitobacter litoralis]HDZ53017.1 hypothetical protein [Sulfitobacter litoralis]